MHLVPSNGPLVTMVFSNDYVTISIVEFKWIIKTIIKLACNKETLWGFLGASSRTLIDRSHVIYFTHFTKEDLCNFFALLRMTKCNLCTVVLTVTLLSPHFDTKLYVCIYSRMKYCFILFKFFFPNNWLWRSVFRHWSSFRKIKEQIHTPLRTSLMVRTVALSIWT